MSSQDFWDDSDKSTKIVKQLKDLKSAVEPWESALKKYSELKDLADILDSGDQGLFLDLNRNIDLLLVELGKLDFKTLLSDERDISSAILSINAGAGGTESCDWVGMLLRMYTRFAQNRGYDVKTTDILYGEEAGVKNVTLLIEGSYAYGYLKAELGVHRLVRISPFDANKRRHTSFASVDVIPEIESNIDIEINEKDIKIDTYRAGGHGGQYLQKTESAIRITHAPTGIVVQSQKERSQYQNKETAMKLLRSKLYEYERDKNRAQVEKHYDEKGSIEWGSQIRSYVFMPYQLVKDHRTGCETGNVTKVMDGDIDMVIEAFLLHKTKETQKA